MTDLRLIAFDFDGVIVESNSIKTEGFGEVYRERWGEAAGEAAVRFHLANPGLSRYEKFARIHQIALGREIAGEESETLGEIFAKYCYESIVRCSYVPGAWEFLQGNTARRAFAIVSATPQLELLAIAIERDIAKYFRHILGKPASKVENLHRILQAESLLASQMLFVGDQRSDYEAAMKVGCHFILRSGQAPASEFFGLPGRLRIPSLKKLEETVKAL